MVKGNCVNKLWNITRNLSRKSINKRKFVSGVKLWKSLTNGNRKFLKRMGYQVLV